MDGRPESKMDKSTTAKPIITSDAGSMFKSIFVFEPLLRQILNTNCFGS